MDPQRERIEQDLRGVLAGDVRCDNLFLQLYATDASLYELRPLAVVRPRGVADVAACLKYASEHQIPVHPRGAGTGLAGAALGPGLVLDLSCHMRRLVALDNGTARVQPGLVHAELNKALRQHGRLFGPDPAMSRVTTMGSVIAVDSGGSHFPRYGSASRHVLSLQVVLADGEVLELGREPLPEETGPGTPTSRKAELVASTAHLARTYRSLIVQHRPKSLVNRLGYRLDEVLDQNGVNMARLICGSEGTLAVVTEATVATQPLARHRGVAILMFAHLDAAAHAVTRIMTMNPSACDLMDRRHLGLAREADPFYDALIPATAEAVLLVEQLGDDPVEISQWLARLVDWARRRGKSFDVRYSQNPEETERFWGLARNVVPMLHRMKGASRPLPFVEDMAVPPVDLASFLVQMQNVLKRHQVIASLFAHAGHGQIHLRPFLDPTNPLDVRKLEPLAKDLYEEVLAVGGTISGEHAAGLSRSPFVAAQYGPLCQPFAEVKRLFDPRNLLNPGKVVSPDQRLLVQNLRPYHGVAQGVASPHTAPLPLVPLQLRWSSDQIAAMAESCNGCGSCRTRAEDRRMCPIFRVLPREEASPRAKANLVRGLLCGTLDSELATDESIKDVADLCVHCHMCRLECPAQVDIPKLMVEVKAAYVRAKGLKIADWICARVNRLSKLGSSLPFLANWALENRQARFFIERFLGIARSRKLPRFSRGSFLRRAARMRLTRSTRRSGRKVLYFVDTYANFHDVDLALALVDVMEHNGAAVYVHPRQHHCGMSMISQGVLDRAKVVAQRNVTLLAEAVRQGYHIVATEPSAALCLKHEYLHLLEDEDARLVAENSSEACTYLWRMHQAGELQLDFKPLNLAVGYHLPCHLMALEVGSPGENLLRLIPGINVLRKERGCSGMAGTWGLKRENFRASLRAGWGLISALRGADVQIGATECSTCKMQMEQGTTKPTVHPIKLLALAYGLRPEFVSLVYARGRDLTIT